MQEYQQTTTTTVDAPPGVRPRVQLDPGSANTAKIMIIDDESVLIKVLRKYLNDAGYGNCLGTTESSDAMAIIRRERPDVILLDFIMPKVDGLEILEMVRGDPRLRHIPVLMLTACTDAEIKVRALELGATDFLSKPLDPNDLIPRVRNTLATKAYQDDLVKLNTNLEAKVEEQTATLREAYAELERKNEEMEQFVYTVSHDLKSPLVTVKGFVGVLKEDLCTTKNDLVVDSIRRIEKAASQMSRLIEDLLKLSRTGRTRGKLEPVDVSALARELTADFQPHLEELGTTIEIDDRMPEIVADRKAISRVFENLLNNAIKYGCKSPNSKITVGSETLGDEVRFFVKDSGPGIAPENHEKIFTLFHRLDSDQDGTGVGLAIVTKIMQVHNGRVWVESSLGDGATFWLSFNTAREAVSDHS